MLEDLRWVGFTFGGLVAVIALVIACGGGPGGAAGGRLRDVVSRRLDRGFERSWRHGLPRVLGQRFLHTLLHGFQDPQVAHGRVCSVHCAGLNRA